VDSVKDKLKNQTADQKQAAVNNMPGQVAPQFGTQTSPELNQESFDKGGRVSSLPRVKVSDGKHRMVIAKNGERILTPEQNKEYESQHPTARIQPLKANLYDAGGDISDISSEPSDEQQLGALGRIGNASPVEEDRGTAMPQANPEPTPEPSEAENIEKRRGQVDQKLDDAIVKGDVVDQGKAQLAHRMIDRHEARLEGAEGGGTPVIETPLGNGTTDVPMAADTSRLPMIGERRQDVTKIATPATGTPDLASPEAGLPVGGATPDLGSSGAAMPRYTGPGRAVPAGQMIPAKQMPTDIYKTKQADLDARIEKMRDKAVDENATPAERAQAQTLADQLELRKAELKRPGATSLLGKIGRGLETAGEIAGQGVAPWALEMVPGTIQNRAAEKRGVLGRIGADIGQEKTLAETEAAGDKTTDKYKEIPGGAVNPASGRTEPAFFNPTDINEPIHFGNVATAPKEGAGATPLGAEGVTNANSGFTDRYQILNPNQTLPKQYVLPANATKADFDRVDKQLENVEKAQGTKAQQEATRAQQRANQADLDRRFEEGRSQKLINYRDADGNLVSGSREEAKAAGVQGKDIHGETSPALQEKARQAYTQYGRMNENAQAALNVLPAWGDNKTWANNADRKAAMDVSKMYWDHMSGSVGLVGGGVNPEYLQQAINSRAYKSMTPEGRELMQDMFTIWSDAINVVKQETGGVPRGQIFLQKEDAILPHPDKAPDMNRQALLSFAKRMHTDAGEYARPSDMKPLPSTLEHTQKFNGQEIQVKNDGTYEYNGHTYKLNPDNKGGTLVK